jgi:hypothetical protein
MIDKQKEDDSKNPGGQRKVTAAEYKMLPAASQGFVSYMQAEWNPDVPKECPYAAGTKAATEWHEGSQQAIFVVMDGEE